MSAILSLKWLPKKPAGKPETAVFLLEKPETAGFPKSQDCPQPSISSIIYYLGIKLLPSSATGQISICKSVYFILLSVLPLNCGIH